MAEKNSLWKNIRNKAKQNRRTGATPKKPTAEMLRQERKIKAKQYAVGGPFGVTNDDNSVTLYNKTQYDPNQNKTINYVSSDDNKYYMMPGDTMIQGRLPEFEVIEQGIEKPKSYKPIFPTGLSENAYDNFSDEYTDHSRKASIIRDTVIDLTNQKMGWFPFDAIPSEQYSSILGNNYVERNTQNTGNPEDYAKNWITRMANPEDTFRNKDYAEEAGSYYHSKDIPAFYGIENGKFKVGSPNDFSENTMIVPVRNSTTPYSKVDIEKGLFTNDMYTYDKSGNKIWNLNSKDKFIVYSPKTKKSFFRAQLDDMTYGRSSEEENSLVKTKKVLEDFLKENPDAYIIPIDEGRFKQYIANPSGVTENQFKKWNAKAGTILENYLIQDPKNPNTPINSPSGTGYGYNMGIIKQKAQGGYMYPEGGGKTYANKQGVIMGPVQNPDGSYTVPVSNEGLPQVNLPEFETIGYEGIDENTDKLLKLWANYNSLYNESFDDPVINNRYNKIKSLYKASGNPKLDPLLPAPRYMAKNSYNFLYSGDESNPKKDSIINSYIDKYSKNKSYMDRSIDPKSNKLSDKLNFLATAILPPNMYSPLFNEVNYIAKNSIGQETDHLVEELSHAYQQNRLNNNVAKAWINEQLNNPTFSIKSYRDKYVNPKSFENEAHSIIAPKMYDYLNGKISLEDMHNSLNYLNQKAQGGYIDGDKDKNKKPVGKNLSRKPIYTSNPNDPRIQMYNDSLDLYKQSNIRFKNFYSGYPKSTEAVSDSLQNIIDSKPYFEFDETSYKKDAKKGFKNIKKWEEYIYDGNRFSTYERSEKNKATQERIYNNEVAPHFKENDFITLKNGVERKYDDAYDGVTDKGNYTDFYPDGTVKGYYEGKLIYLSSDKIKPIRTDYYSKGKIEKGSSINTSTLRTERINDNPIVIKEKSNKNYQNWYNPSESFDVYKKPEQPVIYKKDSNFKPTLSQLDKLQPKKYTSSNQQPGLVGNIENISPSEINMDNFYEGQYEKYRRSPYEDPMYRVWVPGQQMQIVPEEQFKKLNDQYALKDLEQKAQGGYMYPDGGDINPGKQKAVASTTDVSVRALPEGLFEQIKANPPARQPQTISVVDKRKQNPITKKPINPNRDLVGGQFEDTVPIDIITSAYKHGVDPATALSVGLLESRMGTTDPNVGHIMIDPYSDYMPGAEDMVLMMKEKQDYAKKLGYTDPLLQLQAYNGLGVLSNKRGEIGKSAYGLPIPKEGIDLRKNPLYGKKVKNVRDSVIMQSPDLVRLMDYYKPKMDGGYMYYGGGPIQYEVGGKVWKNIAAGLYGAGEGILDTITMGATDQLTDRGFEYLTKVGNKNLDLNDPDDVKFLKTQQQVKGYSNAAGAIGTAVVTGNVQGAISQGTKGLNTAFQASDWASDDFKKWSQGVSGVAGMAAGFAGGLNSDSFNAAAKAGTGVAGFGQKAGKIGSFGNQVTGMFGGNQQPLWQQGEQRQELLNSPDYLAMKEQQNQAYVNQGLSFAANGGNINNNSLNLQNSMRDKYNSYRNRYSKGGTFQKFGINEIPDSAGLHHQNAYGGVPIGPNAMAEGGEFVLDGNYVVSDQVDGMNNQTDEFGRTMAENLKRDLSKYTMRDLNSKNRDGLRRPMDPLAEQTINQIKQKAMMETEIARAEAQVKEQKRQAMVEGALQYAAAGGKLTKDIKKIVEEEYAAAYGGRINPKKYKGLNIPKSKAKGGPVVSNVNQGFDLYAQNRGGMMMAEGGNMYAMGGPDGIPGFDLLPNEYNMMIDQYQNTLPVMNPVELAMNRENKRFDINKILPDLQKYNRPNLPSIERLQPKRYQIPTDNTNPMIDNQPMTESQAKLSGWTPENPWGNQLLPSEPEQIPGPYNPSGQYGFYGKDSKGNDVSINSNMVNEYEQGWKPKGPSNIKTAKSNQPNEGLTGLDYASMGMQALGPLSQLYYGLKGPDDVNYERIKADKIDPYRAITLANEESRRAQDTAGYNLRQNAPTSGSYMANMRALGLGAGKQRGAQTAATQYQADVANTQMQNQVNAQNAQISMQEQIDRLQEKDAARTNVTEGLSGMGSATANMIRDYRTNQVNQTIANNIGTNNFKLDTANKTITYRGDDGQTYTIPLESVIPNNYEEKSNTVKFQRDFGESLNRGFRNRFSGPNAGK